MDFLQTPEFALLLSCSRPAISAGNQQHQQALLEKIDTASFLALVDRHRVAPIVCHHLLQLPAESVPASLLQALRDKRQADTFRQLAMTRELVKLHQLFTAAGIDYVTLKGLPLAQAYYGNAGLRMSKDIDVLVQEGQLDVACHLLQQNGYLPADGYDRLSPRQQFHFRILFQHCDFAAPDSGIDIELHWRLAKYPDMLPRVTVAGIGMSGSHTMLGTQAIPLLPPEAMLLYLCIHGTVHQWFRLKWLFDIPVLLDSHDWDWSALFAHAESAHCARHLALGLALSQQICGWNAPAPVADWLARQDSHRVIGDVFEALQLPEDAFVHTPSIAVFLRRFRYNNVFMTGVKRWRYNLHQLGTTPNDWAVLPLPDALFPLYFLLRPFLWLWRRFRRSAQEFTETP